MPLHPPGHYSIPIVKNGCHILLVTETMGGLPSYCAFYVRFCSTQRIVAFDECMNPNGLGQPLETWLTDLIEYGHFKISGLHLHLTQQVIGKSSDILVCW